MQLTGCILLEQKGNAIVLQLFDRRCITIMGCTSSSVDVVRNNNDTTMNELLTTKEAEMLRWTWDIISDEAEEVGVIMFAR